MPEDSADRSAAPPTGLARIWAALAASVSLNVDQHGRSYRLPLDGYRGIFIVLVMAYHFGATALAGGWIGINHFFVFSGFLIGGILIKEVQRTGTIRLVPFYVRRARRILPAASLLVIAVLVYFSINQTHRREGAGDAFATMSFWLNWRLIARGDDYFSLFDFVSPLRHAWTLSVEEQFYAIAPLLVLAIFALVKRRSHRVWLLVGLAGVSALWTAHLVNSGASGAHLYYGTDVRVQALLIGLAGAALATPDSDGSRWSISLPLTHLLGWIGMVISLGAFFMLNETSTGVFAYGGVFLFGIAAACMGFSALETRPILLNQLVSFAPFVHLGQISYGLYLYHWPISLWWPESWPDGLLGGLLKFALTWVCAVASYRLVEVPVLRYGVGGLIRKAGGSLRGATWAGPAIVTALLLAAGSMYVRTPQPSADDINITAALAPAPVAEVPPTKVALAGDSIAYSLFTGYQANKYPGLSILNHTTLGCRALPTTVQLLTRRIEDFAPCKQWRTEWPRQAKQQEADVVVFPAGLQFLGSLVIDGQPRSVDSPEGRRAFTGELDAELKQTERAGAQQLIIPNVPCRYLLRKDLPPDLRQGAPEFQAVDPTAVNKQLNQWAAKHPGKVRVLDLNAQLCPQGKYRSSIDGIPLYRDGVHFTPAGAALVWTWLAGQVAEARNDRASDARTAR